MPQPGGRTTPAQLEVQLEQWPGAGRARRGIELQAVLSWRKRGARNYIRPTALGPGGGKGLSIAFQRREGWLLPPQSHRHKAGTSRERIERATGLTWEQIAEQRRRWLASMGFVEVRRPPRKQPPESDSEPGAV
jgi:hypothetical protein